MSTDKTVSTIIHAGQEAMALQARVEEIRELQQLVADLRKELVKADKVNDDLVTENCQLKTEVKQRKRELWDAVHAVLVEYKPGK